MSRNRRWAILAIVMALLGLSVWIIEWVLWAFILQEVGYDGPLFWLARVCDPAKAAFLVLALILVCVAVMKIRPGTSEDADD